MSRLVSIPLAAYPPDALVGLSTGAFNIGAARAAMWLSQLAYEEEAAKVATVLAGWQLTALLIFDRPGSGLFPSARTRGFLAQGRGATVLSFGGTDPLVLSNWITNFRIGCTAAGAHRGFSEALDVMWSEISSALAKTPAPLLCVGHSLGGAMALLAALRALDEQGRAPAAVYGFGMPRPGNAALAARANAAFGARIYRLAHGLDLVPSLPPVGLGFCHAGRYLHCAGQGQFDASLLSPGPTQEPVQPAKGSFDWLARMRNMFRISGYLPAPIGDHLPPRYWNALAGSGVSNSPDGKLA